MNAATDAGTCAAGPRTPEDHAAAVRALIAPVLARLRDAAPDRLAIDAAELAGRALAERVAATIPLPPFDNSQMDGYAVLASDLADASEEEPVALALGIATAAGDPPAIHAPGTASPVMTGAAVPVGADAIVPVEAALPPRFPRLVRAHETVRPEGAVSFSAPLAPGTFVRPRGEDVAEGALVGRAGDALTPARIGTLAAAGITEVPVRRRPRVLICATGDELAARGEALPPGRIHDANTPMLAAMLRDAGAEVRVARCPDDPAAMLRLLEEATESVDLAVTSGGISAGAFEVVREALAPLGGRFVGVAMQPGGPQGLAEAPLPVVCFPGNPVSSWLSAELFLLPLLREYAGAAARAPREPRPLAHDTNSPPGKLQLRRGRVEADGSVTLGAPGSHLLGELADAEVIAEIPIGVGEAPAGMILQTWKTAPHRRSA